MFEGEQQIFLPHLLITEAEYLQHVFAGDEYCRPGKGLILPDYRSGVADVDWTGSCPNVDRIHRANETKWP